MKNIRIRVFDRKEKGYGKVSDRMKKVMVQVFDGNESYSPSF